MPQLLKRIGSNLGETESYARDMREYQAIKLAFLSLDPYGSGYVSIDALKQALLASAVPFTMEEVSSRGEKFMICSLFDLHVLTHTDQGHHGVKRSKRT